MPSNCGKSSSLWSISLVTLLFAYPGYEKYNTIRADPTLCFLDRVGRPDEKAIAAEQRSNDFMDGWVQYYASVLGFLNTIVSFVRKRSA